jgi:D-alanyl-D-alanine carboxypeptidase/D-alanyl-D-alanine-endopeptidase (penicillin-binding protein 4)
MKLVTTFAALTYLGPTYTWKTQIHVPGVIGSGGTVKDVWIRGGGDPYLVLEEYWKMLSTLRDKGVRRIEGDLVIDSSAFDLAPEDAGAFDGQPDRVYNLPPHALLVNFNSVRFLVRAQADGKVGTRAFPALPNLTLVSRLQPSAGRCGGYQYGVAFNLQDPTHRNRAEFDGTFPLKCRQFEFARTVLTPETYAHGLFELYWQALGGESKGRMRTEVLPPQPKRALVEHPSRSLGEIIRLVNKFSNNVMTRHVELALGAERFGSPATIDKGHRAITEVLNESGINTEGLVIANSAGLSRDSRISARQLAQILDAAWRSPFMPEYVSSLALVGMDGTMRSRLNGTSGAGRMHVKTGRLDHVSAIAGYVDAQSGQRLLVVLLLNTRNAHLGPGNLLQNAVLTWVHDQH